MEARAGEKLWLVSWLGYKTEPKHKQYMNLLRMTPQEYDRHLRTRPAYGTDAALFDAMDRNAREAWIKAFRRPKRRGKVDMTPGCLSWSR
jgi:hypothetical protein